MYIFMLLMHIYRCMSYTIYIHVKQDWMQCIIPSSMYGDTVASVTMLRPLSTLKVQLRVGHFFIDSPQCAQSQAQAQDAYSTAFANTVAP